jgi:hypothetical protein
MVRISLFLIGLLTISSILCYGGEVTEYIDANGQKSYVIHFNNDYNIYPESNGNNLSIDEWANRNDQSIPRQEWENLQFWENYDKLNQFRHDIIDHPEALKELLNGDKQAALNQLLNNPHDGFDLNAFVQAYLNNLDYNQNLNNAENKENLININNTNGSENIPQNTSIDNNLEERKFLHYPESILEQKLINDTTPINNDSLINNTDFIFPHEEDKSWIDLAKEKYNDWMKFGTEFPGERKDNFSEYYFYNQEFLNKYPNEKFMNESDFNRYLERINVEPTGFIAKTKQVLNNAKDTVKEYAGKIKDYAVDKFHNITGTGDDLNATATAPQIDDFTNKNPTQEDLEANKKIQEIDFEKNAELGKQNQFINGYSQNLPVNHNETPQNIDNTIYETKPSQ